MGSTTSDFPSALDNFPDQPTLAAGTLGSDGHSSLTAKMGDAITKVEAYVLLTAAFGGEFIDPSQAPYNCDMTGATPNGTTSIGAGDGTAADGSDANHGFMKAVYDAWQTGKPLLVPPGTIAMLRDDGVTPAIVRVDLSVFKRRVLIRGCGSEGVSVLSWPNQLGVVSNPLDLVLGGDPSGRVANIALDAYNSNNTNSSFQIEDLTLEGPAGGAGYGNFGDTEDRHDGWAIRAGGRIRVSRVEAYGWHAAACYRMRGPDHNIDHNIIRDCNFHNNWYNLYWSYYWPVSGANSGDGDHVIHNTMMSQASKASRALDPAGICFDSEITSCHGGFGPFGWYGEFGPQTEVKVDGSDAHATAAGTVARDAAGVITIDTKIPAYAPPWGVFDNSDQPWNHGTVVACGGFIVGDVIDLADVAASGHVAGSLATDAKCTGRITAKAGTVLTILMEHPVASTAFSAVTVTGGGLTSHYNNQHMLDTNVEYGGTYEGLGNCNIFAPNRAVLGYATTSQLPFHSLMSVDNNKGTQNAYSPILLSSLTRVNTTHPGQAHASNGDVMLITGVAPTGTPMGVDDNWFINTPTAGTFKDDNPPSGAWSQDKDAIRGVQRILTVVDNGTTCTFTFQQQATGTNNYTEKVLGNGSAGSAGACGRVAAFVCQNFEIHEGPTFDCSAHPPDSGDIGGKLAAIELVAQFIHSSRFHMLQGIGFYPRLMPGATDTSSEPVRSVCIAGDREAPITHTTATVMPGDIVEFSGKDDVRPYQGGTVGGVALWGRQSGDFILYMRRGILRAETGYDGQGVRSLVAFAQGDQISVHGTFHGVAAAVSGSGWTTGSPIVGRCTNASTQSFTSITGVATDTTADTLNATAHGLGNDRRVFLTGLSSTTGIANNTPYYTVNATANTVQLATTKGGSPINLTGSNDAAVVINGLYTTSLRIEPRNPIP